MREIKFRVYRKYPNPEMIYFTLEDIIFLRKPVDIIQEFEGIRKTLMQYTGLKDKNGKEIYEGDIVKIYCKEYNYEGYEEDHPRCDIGVIEYSNMMSFEIKMKNKCYSSIILDCKHTGLEFWFEIIGNIYENSGLLEGDK
ncbi:YopX family protein [Clostridium botulinum]|uniref:YopX family protein n=1 Tax=Clostridium botulinum TaxID=1491 RepID=UPI002147FFDB|nr:YopX family protein [Clostridium botulinum]MCR1167336.1 YopX family protein [Clostridium botulinum]